VGHHRGVVLNFARPDEPKDNAFIEMVNEQFQAEGLNAH
jgi:hypothetical protein